MLERILVNTEELLIWARKEHMTVADIKAKVDAETTVEQSAITLLTNLSALIKANANDPAAIQAIGNELDADNAALAAAVTNNTPAAS